MEDAGHGLPLPQGSGCRPEAAEVETRDGGDLSIPHPERGVCLAFHFAFPWPVLRKIKEPGESFAPWQRGPLLSLPV